MNILCISYEYPPIGGGGSVVAAALNEELVRRGDRVRVLTSGMRALAPRETVNGVDVHRVRCWRPHAHVTTWAELATTLWPTWRAACELIEAERPDVIHTHFALPGGWLARRLARRYGIPYVLTAHGSDIPGYNPDRFRLLHRLLKPIWRRIMLDAAAVTSPSLYLADLIRSHVRVPVRVIPNGYSPGPRQPQVKQDIALVVARLFPRKGVEHFIEAVQTLGGDWQFVIAGDGPHADTLRSQAANGTAPVHFAGFVERMTLRELYEQARIMVFPSLRENFPMVLLEAMDAGCAIITTDAEGCAEVVGDAGVVVPRGESAGIREALRTLMADHARCEALGERALARAQRFRWPRLGAMYRACFADVMQARVATESGATVPAPRFGSLPTTADSPDEGPARPGADGLAGNAVSAFPTNGRVSGNALPGADPDDSDDPLQDTGTYRRL